MPLEKNKMRAAIAELRSAVASLDSHMTRCSKCGLNVYRNRKEYDQKLQTEAFIQKLERWMKNSP